MNDVKKAPFRLDKYRVIKFSFIEPIAPVNDIVVKFNPSGVFNLDNSTFHLSFDFSATYSSDRADFVNVTFVSDFIFEEETSFENIPSFFYRNIIAIVFPYLRSFISTLTVLANDRPFILPILNLSGLEEELRKNTIVKTEP